MAAEMRTRVMVLGATGMLGSTVMRRLAQSPDIEVRGTARSGQLLRHLPASLHEQIVLGVQADDPDSLLVAFERVRPDVVINCVGVVKQLAGAMDPLVSIPINSLLPHRLARLCAVASARLVHISTDCVFDGKKGGYVEQDPADATDLYGRSKHLGEVDYPNAITLRTSIIGHELDSAVGLLGWFLASSGEVRGFRRAVFSGVPTVELCDVIRDYVLPRPELHGLFHVAAEAINKHDLLQLVAKVYGKDIRIVPDDSVAIDRSLNADRFRAATGYRSPGWTDLIEKMHAFG